MHKNHSELDYELDDLDCGQKFSLLCLGNTFYLDVLAGIKKDQTKDDTCFVNPHDLANEQQATI